MWVGWPLTSLSIGLLWFLDTKTPLPVLIIINAGVGFGAGTIASALNVAILATTKREDNGHAMAMGWLFKSAGMCMGIAIGTAVFTVQMEKELEKIGGADMTAQSFLRVLNEVKDDPTGREVIVNILRILWLICCVLSGLVGLLCCSCKYPPLYNPGSVVDVEVGDSAKQRVASEKGSSHHLSVGSTTSTLSVVTSKGASNRPKLGRSGRFGRSHRA